MAEWRGWVAAQGLATTNTRGEAALVGAIAIPALRHLWNRSAPESGGFRWFMGEMGAMYYL